MRPLLPLSQALINALYVLTSNMLSRALRTSSLRHSQSLKVDKHGGASFLQGHEIHTELHCVNATEYRSLTSRMADSPGHNFQGCPRLG